MLTSFQICTRTQRNRSLELQSKCKHWNRTETLDILFSKIKLTCFRSMTNKWVEGTSGTGPIKLQIKKKNHSLNTVAQKILDQYPWDWWIDKNTSFTECEPQSEDNPDSVLLSVINCVTLVRLQRHSILTSTFEWFMGETELPDLDGHLHFESSTAET